MVASNKDQRHPLSVVVTGEAQNWGPALERIVGPQLVRPLEARGSQDVLRAVDSGLADAAVIDETPELGQDALQLLRMIRRMNANLPVVVITQRRDRIWLEQALRLSAFSVMAKPLELEALLRQLARMMDRLDRMLRNGPPGRPPRRNR